MDIANAGDPVILPAARILPQAREPLPEYVGPSNRVNAVGQMAKTAVQDGREAGLDLPKNAKGYAASQIARGADPESVFSALVAQSAPLESGADDADPAVEPADGEAVGAADEIDGDDTLTAPAESSGVGEGISLTPAETAGLSPEQTALDLLSADQVA